MASKPDFEAQKNKILNEVIALNCPLVMMPYRGELPPLLKNGRRYILAKNGLFLEVLAPAGRFCINIAQFDHHIPYGVCQERIEFVFSKETGDTRAQISEFIEHARSMLPNESAAWIIWNLDTQQMRLQILEPFSASPSSVTFARPKLNKNECLAIDIHSHGTLPAFFSLTDDADDQGDIKTAMVIGNLDKEPTVATQLCVLDLKFDVEFDFTEVTK